MVLLRALEIVVTLLFLYGLVTQLAMPLVRGTSLFPFFKKQRGLEHKLAETRQKSFENEIGREILEEEEKLNKKQGGQS